MERVKAAGLVLCVLGLAVSLYLTFEAFDPHIPLSCPSTPYTDCFKVTTSPYSHIFGIPVALLGLLWFIVLLSLFVLDFKAAILPFWTLGLVFVGYLIFSEVFLIHSICLYCTAVHVTVVALGYPAAKLSLSGE